MMEIYSSFDCGDVSLLYCREENQMDFLMIPSGMKSLLLSDGKQPESMIQFKLADTPSHVSSDVMRNSPCVHKLDFFAQNQSEDRVVSRFRYGPGVFFDHIAELHNGWIRVWVEVRNNTETELKFDYLSSFSIGMLSPFLSRPDNGKYFLERVNSCWHHEEVSMERSGLEVSGSFCFGGNGSMPVMGYYPFAGIEDREHHVLWGTQLEPSGAWSLEISRHDGSLSISGGSLDRRNGGWFLLISPGESYRSMSAVLTCVKGNILDLFNRLHSSQYDELKACVSPIYHGPFSDRQIRFMKTYGVKYYVLDTDLSAKETYSCIKKIKDSGLIPGITLELETLSEKSSLASCHPKILQTSEGCPIQAENFVFPDMRNQETSDEILQNLIHELRKNSIGYVRFHCPVSFCGGCGGDNSPQENQNQYTKSVHDFYRKISKAMPALVMEFSTARSGRFSAGWMTLADLVSSSDSLPDMTLPMRALDRQMLAPGNKCAVCPNISQGINLWYQLTASLLGRLVLSGDLASLSDSKKRILLDFSDFYHSAESLLRNGSYRLGHDIGDSCSNPSGWQVFYKESKNMQLIVVHTFRNPPKKLSFDISPGMKLVKYFSSVDSWTVHHQRLEMGNCRSFIAAAYLFQM